MQIQDLVKAYEAKSDEELMQLATAREQLTPEARLALESELSRRQISIAERSGASQNEGKWHDSGRESVSERLQQGERQGVGDFVAEVLRAYHSHFWLFRVDTTGEPGTRGGGSGYVVPPTQAV
jgi:LAS superfamily LD-carboxypeptidase LdcB